MKHFMVISRKNYKKAKALKAKLFFYKKFREIKSFPTSRFHELFIKNVYEYSVISTLKVFHGKQIFLLFHFFLNRKALKITKQNLYILEIDLTKIISKVRSRNCSFFISLNIFQPYLLILLLMRVI